MYLRLPVGFDFSSPRRTRDIIDNQVVKYLKTWKKQRLYKPDYGVDWRSFDYVKGGDPQTLRRQLASFVQTRLSKGLPQVSVVEVLMGPSDGLYNNFSFYLVYSYKGLLQSKVFVQINLDGQVPVNVNLGSF